MSQDELVVLLFKVVLIACEVAALGWAGVYTWLAPWWKQPIGRTIMWLDLLLAAALVPTILALFLHFSRLTSHVAAWFDLGVFTLIAVALLARIPLFIRVHREKRDTGSSS